MEPAFTSLLLGYAPLSAFIGERINWNLFPQGIASPAIRLSLISRVTRYHMQGADALDEARLQVDVRVLSPPDNDAGGYATAHGAASAVKACLSGYRGTVGDRYFGGIFLLSERQTAEQAENELFHRFSMDFQVWSRAA